MTFSITSKMLFSPCVCQDRYAIHLISEIKLGICHNMYKRIYTCTHTYMCLINCPYFKYQKAFTVEYKKQMPTHLSYPLATPLSHVTYATLKQE